MTNEQHSTQQSYDEINKILDELGIQDIGFFDIEKWKDMSPQDVENIRSHFEWVAEKAKERKNKK